MKGMPSPLPCRILGSNGLLRSRMARNDSDDAARGMETLRPWPFRKVWKFSFWPFHGFLNLRHLQLVNSIRVNNPSRYVS